MVKKNLVFVFEKIVEIFTGKPDYVNYIKTKLRKRFKTKIVSSETEHGKVSFCLSLPKTLTNEEKIHTAKAFGLTLRNMRFVKISDTLWEITFSSNGVKAIQGLIQTFPNLRQQINMGKTFLDFEPKEETILTHEQKMRLRKEQKQILSISIDIANYLMSIPFFGYLLRRLYLNRHIFLKIFSHMPKYSNKIKILPWFLAGLALFYLFIYTFVLWATLLCLLIAGYGLYKLKDSVNVKYN